MQIQAVFPYWPLYRAAWIFLRANPQNTRKVVSSDPSDPLYVFRMSTLLWALTVLQHETLKQQPQFSFFFFFSSFQEFSQRHCHATQTAFETFHSVGITADPPVRQKPGMRSLLTSQPPRCPSVFGHLRKSHPENMTLFIYSSRVVHNLKHWAGPHLWND